VSGPSARIGGPEGPHVDLHAHSTASDGSRLPTAVVVAAKAAGLSAIALTDHDTMDGVAEAVAAADELGIRVVPGVELSATDDQREIHLLGLHIQRASALEESLRAFRERRHARAIQIVAKLNELGVAISFDDVLARAGDAAIGRPHLARVLIEGGWARDSRDAFDRYLGSGRPAYVPKHRLSVADAIALVHAGGGLAVLAHPGPEGRRETIGRFVALGLDGVEVRHPGHTAEDTHRLAALTEFFGLVPSGGSDWHGAAEGPRVLGVMRVPFSWLEQQDARVETRRSAGTLA
jgi:predicted metal-dependent phosphoesterase TrpH